MPSPLLQITIQLYKERDNFAYCPETLLADMVLMAFVNDVLESNAAAMAILAAGQEENAVANPHRAFSSIRTAFEAAQQATVLVTQDDYRLAGTKAWIYYCRRDQKWLAQAKPEGSGITSLEDAENWFEEKIKSITDIWEQVSPGKANVVRQARLDLEKQPRKPDNWLGKDMALAQDDAYKKFASLHNVAIDQSMSSTNRAIYSSMSREIHTGLRIDSSYQVTNDANGLKVTFPPRDNSINTKKVIRGAELAVDEMLMALEYRAHILKK